jgi:hypothetical protein
MSQYLKIGCVCALVAAAVAAGVVLVSSGSSEAAPTKSQYFARVAAICRTYGPKLDKISPPIAKLGEALRAAKEVNLRGIQVAYVSFVVTGAKAQRLGHKIGFPSPPC